MSISTDFDLTQAGALVRDLQDAQTGIHSAIRPVVTKGALNVKNGAIERISGHPKVAHYPRTISYDIEVDATGVSAEIGPDKDRFTSRNQAPLGNILEFGTSRNAPIPHLWPALKAEEPNFVDAITAAAAAQLGRR